MRVKWPGVLEDHWRAGKLGWSSRYTRRKGMHWPSGHVLP